MRSQTALLLMALGAGLWGCSSNDAGGVTEGLTAVNPADYEGVTRFYNPALSARPLAVDEIGDTSGAYAVQMTFGNKYAVAWAVVDGVARINEGDAVVGVWRIYETPDATPIDGTTSPGEIPTVTVPDTGHDAPDAVEPGPLGNPLLGRPDGRLTNPIDVNATPVYARPGLLWLSWLDEASDEYRDIFNNQSIHGGCL